jgi:hypothetical protein
MLPTDMALDGRLPVGTSSDFPLMTGVVAITMPSAGGESEDAETVAGAPLKLC